MIDALQFRTRYYYHPRRRVWRWVDAADAGAKPTPPAPANGNEALQREKLSHDEPGRPSGAVLANECVRVLRNADDALSLAEIVAATDGARSSTENVLKTDSRFVRVERRKRAHGNARVFFGLREWEDGNE